VRLQLAIAKKIVHRLDWAQDFRTLAPHELALRRKAKLCSLGLASLQRTLVRQRSRITYLAEGDANTKFFHLQACHRSRKNFITKLCTTDAVLLKEEEMAEAVFDHFDSIMGTQGCQQVQLDLNELHLPVLTDILLDRCFTEEEIWQAIVYRKKSISPPHL